MSIPRGPEDVTPSWLGSVLDADVRGVDVTPIGTGQTGATYRVAATYAAEQSDVPTSFAVKLQRTGRRGPRARRPRLPLGGRVLLADRRRDGNPRPAELSHRDLRGRRGRRAASRRYGARGAGRPDRRLLARRGAAGGGGPRRTARPELVRSTVDGPACHRDAETGRRRRREGTRRHIPHGRRHRDRPARREDQPPRTRKPSSRRCRL